MLFQRGENRGEDHDWHSREYVDDWIDWINQKSHRRVRQRRQRYQFALDEFSFDGNETPRILDMGVGWGDLTKEIFTFFPNAQVVGLDYSSEMLKRAGKNLSELAGQVTLHQADLTTANVLNGLGMFDGIISSSTLHHLTPAQLDLLLLQIVDHLEPHGQFINSDAFYRSKRIRTRIYWRLAETLRWSGITNTYAEFFEKTAFQSQSNRNRPASDSGKPRLEDYLSLLDKHGMKTRWRCAFHRFIVIAEPKDCPIRS